MKAFTWCLEDAHQCAWHRVYHFCHLSHLAGESEGVDDVVAQQLPRGLHEQRAAQPHDAVGMVQTTYQHVRRVRPPIAVSVHQSVYLVVEQQIAGLAACSRTLDIPMCVGKALWRMTLGRLPIC